MLRTKYSYSLFYIFFDFQDRALGSDRTNASVAPRRGYFERINVSSPDMICKIWSKSFVEYCVAAAE